VHDVLIPRHVDKPRAPAKVLDKRSYVDKGGACVRMVDDIHLDYVIVNGMKATHIEGSMRVQTVDLIAHLENARRFHPVGNESNSED